MRVAFRVDSGLVIGSGHLMRCLTLGDELRRRGLEIVFICRDHPENLIHRLESAEYQVCRLSIILEGGICPDDYATWVGASQEQDVSEMQAILSSESYDWLVVDHYGLDIEWEKKLRSIVGKILVIDDLANRNHDCDVLLDQNYFGEKTRVRYQGLVSSACKSLLGPQFALLEPRYPMLRGILPESEGKVYRVLIFFGSSDFTEEICKVLVALSSPELSHLVVDVVVGSSVDAIEKIKGKISLRPMTTFYQNLSSLSGLMTRADMVIGAGGATTWERMCLGVPSFAMSMAANQQEVTDALFEDHLQLVMHKLNSALDWQQAIYRFINTPDLVKKISRNARQLVDGYGCVRVASLMSTTRSCVPRFSETLRISILSDEMSWIANTVKKLEKMWSNLGHIVNVVTKPSELLPGDVCFILSCSHIVNAQQLGLNRYNLVVHADELPKGRGWSPMTWRILEGENKICVTLFEAASQVDAGPIYDQEWIELSGTELIDEWRKKLAVITESLCNKWISGFPMSASSSTPQMGEPTYWPRRGPIDSRIDLNKSVSEQFNLLRVVDNNHYPAFFEYLGQKYQLRIEKLERSS